MRLILHVETGDLGRTAGKAKMTVTQPDTVYLLVDPTRLANPEDIRDVIMEELDVALLCLMYRQEPEAMKALLREQGRTDVFKGARL